MFEKCKCGSCLSMCNEIQMRSGRSWWHDLLDRVLGRAIQYPRSRTTLKCYRCGWTNEGEAGWDTDKADEFVDRNLRLIAELAQDEGKRRGR